MRILLDAYFDNNFGDDLFIRTLLTRYDRDLFYALWRNLHPGVLTRALEYPNLVLLPDGCCSHTLLPMDGYIMIGGDVLPDGVDYSRRIAGMRHVKENGGFVSMLGFSLYEQYGDKTRQDLEEMAALADSIVPRDAASARRFLELVPTARITPATDMVFTGSYGSAEPADPVLGIAPRRKLYSTDREHEDFCDTMAALADGWLADHPGGSVRFLALSTGEYDDEAVSRDIVAKMTYPDRTQILCHGKDDLIEGFRSCTALIPTRFHALVFGLMFRIPFIPVPYEVKLTQLLDELGYTGPRIPYGAAVSAEDIAAALANLDAFPVEEVKLAAYLKKAEDFFPETDRCMTLRRNTPTPMPQLPPCPTAAALETAQNEIAQLNRDKDYLDRQITELNTWIAQLQQQKQELEAELAQNESLRKAQTAQLNTAVEHYAALDARFSEQAAQMAEQSAQLAATVENYAALDARFQETEALRQQQLAQLHQTTADYAALDSRFQEQTERLEAQAAQIAELTPLAEKYRRICEKLPFVDKMMK